MLQTASNKQNDAMNNNIHRVSGVLFSPSEAFTTGRNQPKAGFGHFGYGGSGAWADLDTGMSIALTLNKIVVTTPVADVRLAKIGAAAWKAAQRRA